MEEEYPECPICLDIFGNKSSHIKAPKVLKCGDSICKVCLRDIINYSKEEYILCPMCKEKIKKEENIDDYTTNKDLIKVVNTFFNIPKKEIEKQKGDKPIKYNIILLGNPSVGKTSIFQRLSKDIYRDNHFPTIGFDISTYYFKYKNKKYELIINDTAGQERYNALTKTILRKKDGVLFIFDISNEESFESLEAWYELYKEQNEKVVGLLIGNKCDCKPKINKEKAEKFAEEHGLKYIETSAKLDKNIKKAIVYLLEEIIKSKETSKPEEKIELEENNKLAQTYFSLNSDIATSSYKKNKKLKKKCGC